MDDNGNFTYIKEDYIRNIKEIINSINEQNFREIFPGYNFTELLPELPIQENGHPNIDYKIYIISNEEIEKLESILDDSLINTESDFWYNLDEFKSSTMIDDNGNFTFLQPHIKFIKQIIETINEQNFIEIFPGYNFTELLPELPIQENVKVLNTLSKLDDINIDTINIDNRNYSTFSEYLELFGDNNSMNENNEYIFNINITILKMIQIIMIKQLVILILIKMKEMNLKQKMEVNSRNYSKPGFNLKIRGGKELFGRRQFKLRSDSSEPSYMENK
ncbi:hypothetical protein LY90DRAFT_519937 [Neocallimastix californiae]|uniref:Uncharacterized protein n=1 Tax=Neocallimastix californiae TaxID=1754190 RepID=A0A1Y1YNH2_9FUNG|nr:hypothetical protein LY90DRAFT_519937 [Neocallimastix californiae]|eukprot:ORX99134.1 hypothetical protein LY90DRAFT_519937 [Neocallimastix californiae]